MSGMMVLGKDMMVMVYYPMDDGIDHLVDGYVTKIWLYLALRPAMDREKLRSVGAGCWIVDHSVAAGGAVGVAVGVVAVGVDADGLDHDGIHPKHGERT